MGQLGTVKGPTLCLLEKHTSSGHGDSRKKLEIGYIKPAIPTSLPTPKTANVYGRMLQSIDGCVFYGKRKKGGGFGEAERISGKIEDVKSE